MSFYKGKLLASGNSGGHWFALTNGGRLWTVERTRRECRKEAERITGEPWPEASKYCEIRKVNVVEVAK